MIFCDDSDLMRVQPYVFEQGVASFEELHEVAGDEVVRDCRMYWLSTLPVVAPAAVCVLKLMAVAMAPSLAAVIVPVESAH